MCKPSFFWGGQTLTVVNRRFSVETLQKKKKKKTRYNLRKNYKNLKRNKGNKEQDQP